MENISWLYSSSNLSQCQRHLLRTKSNPEIKEFREKYNDGDETKREMKQQFKIYLPCSDVYFAGKAPLELEFPLCFKSDVCLVGFF